MRQLPQALGVYLFHPPTFLVIRKSVSHPAYLQECEIEWDVAETRCRPSYLEEVRDIRMDLVNHSNTIIEDVSSLIGV